MTDAARRFGRVALAMAALLWGCASPQPPSSDALSQLSVGVATEADVRRVLGEPTRRGRLRSGSLDALREVWTYEHTVGNEIRDERQVVLVFLRDGRYDGSLWLASMTLIEPTQ